MSDFAISMWRTLSVMSAHLPLDDLLQWAHGQGPAPVVLDEQHVQQISAAEAGLRAAGRSGAVYGLTTGVGALRSVPTDISSGKGSVSLRLWRSHAAGFGESYDDPTALAGMAIRLHQITSGRSGVSGELAAALAGAVESRAVPDLHRCGSIGTGDLVPLAELGLTLVGELPWRSGSAPVAGVADGDALPFMSSNALTLATSALAMQRLLRLSIASERVTALSAAALQASLQAYDPRVHAGRPDAGQARVAARLMELLDDGVAREPARVQDPFCLRTVPQVHAPFVDSLLRTRRTVSVEIDDPSENPMVLEGGVALHHGGFVTARLSAALDSLRQATYPVLALSTARLSALTNPSLTGLPAFLASGPADSSGVMILEYLAQDALAQARTMTTPVSTGHAVVSLGLEEHASFSTQAARWSEAVVGSAAVVLACELVAAVRALRAAPERLPDSPVRACFEAAAAVLDADKLDRPLGADVELAVRLVEDGLPA
jgi:histidine ammonia-lyase